MSKVIFKLKFQSPNFKNTKMNNMYHLIYIGTREGVALNDDMKEFENNHNKSTNDEYMKYISDRPRSHGLFGKDNQIIDLKEISNYMKEYNGYVYRGIVSLREDEAIEKGFDKKENWETLVRDKMFYISKQLNIPYNKLEWVGAFHRESGHPHIHLMIWNKEPEVRNIGAIPKKNIEAIRKELTKEIFNNEYENVLSLKNIYRDFLTDTTKGINKSDYSNRFLELDEKVDEINTKYEIKKYQEKIRVLTKEISESNNTDDIHNKEAQIENLKIKIDEATKKIKMYDIKDTIKGLEQEKKSISKSEVKNDKIIEFEDRIKALEMDLDNASGENIERIQNEILNLKNEINNEKEAQISKDIDTLELELNLIKDEIGFIDVEYNDFILEDRVRGKTLEEIGEMIIELQVPKEGRLQYKLMPPDVKAQIDKITDKIVEMPQYRKMFYGYLKSVEDLTKLYTDKIEDIEEAKANAKDDIYKRIGNNILKTKKEIVVDNKKPDFAVQKLFTSIAKMFSTNTNRNEKTRLVTSENSKAERKKQYQESKARGLYSEYDLE